MSTLIETFDTSAILTPAQEPADARWDAAAFGPNQTIRAGQVVALKTADKKLYAYSTGGTLPSIPTPTGVLSAGGTLANGAYKAKITALFGTRESAVSTESAGVTATTGNNTITWSWAAVAGATGYNLYRTAAAGSADSETLLVTIPAGVLTYADTGAIALSATAMPGSAGSAPSDGTQTAVGLSQRSFVTDSAGKAYEDYSVTVGSPINPVAGYRKSPQSTMPYFKTGTFDPADLIGSDAAALTSLGARTLANGYVKIP